MNIPTLLRIAEHKALMPMSLNGSILDLGGDARSDYRSLIAGDHIFTTVNLDKKTHPDIVHDLEEPLPITAGSYDNALLINVLEHVYEYRQLLREASRVVRSRGTIVIAVPFLYPIHPSPKDFWRFTTEALRKECETAGLRIRSITPLGGGVFSARYVMGERLMPAPVRFVGFVFVRPVIMLLDWMFSKLARLLGRKYDPADYALGYLVNAEKF